MGKASRLKRLRKLGTLSERALAARVQLAHPDQPMKIISNAPGLEKMSKVLEDFAEPWLECVQTEDDYAKVVGLAALAWNSALLPEEERFRDLDQEVVDGLGKPGYELLQSMIHRKLTCFPDCNRPILDYELTCIDGNLRLNVVSGIPNAAQFLGPPGTQPMP
jgi:hypothetical protein